VSRRLPPELNDPDIYRALVEGIPAIVYVDQPDELSTNFYTSPQAVDLLGFTQEEWGASPDLWVQQLHPDDRERVIEENRRSNEERDRFFSEYRFIAKDGRVVWIRDEAVLVFAPDGTPLYWRGVMLDITAQKEAEEKLRWSLDVLRRTSQQRRELMQRLEGAREQERRRIASDLHDDSIQVISAVDMRLQLLAMQGGADAATLQGLHEEVMDAVRRMRAMLFELRPAMLDHEGLAAALRAYLEHIASETGMETSFRSEALLREPEPELRATLFRLAQEALMNIRKHSAATWVEIVIETLGDGASLRVIDNGAGFDPALLSNPAPGHLGLSSMVERAEASGGWCRIASAPGAGTTVEFWLPLEPAAI
jgi:PAS domain S-box-containing protein